MAKKKLYTMKDQSISIMAETKYEALYKASTTLNRVVDWTEMALSVAYMPRYVSDVLVELNPKGIYKPVQ